MMSGADTPSGALRRSQAAQTAFMAVPARTRQLALRSIAASILGDVDALASMIVREGVKTIREARREVERAAETFFVAAEEAVRSTGETVDMERTAAGDGRWGHWERRPLGTVLAVTPYNDPLNLVAHKVAPAIAVGCPIIVKPHEATPGPAHRIAEYAALTTLPDGTVTIVEGGPDVVRALASDDRVRMVSFTGGARAGRAVAEAAGAKRIALELGGIGASYVHADAAIDRAAERLASGIVWAAGQNCVHTQHVVVHEEIADELVSALVRRLEAMHCGDRMYDLTDIARQISVDAASGIERLVDDAVAAGATILARVRCDDPETVGPCLLTDVPADHPVATHEVFGPVAVLTRVAGLEEAVERVRALGPSINTSIFSDSLSAVRRWDLAIDAGTTIVNDSTDFRVDHMPFGGNGNAGIGREGVRYAMEAMTERHMIVFAA